MAEDDNSVYFQSAANSAQPAEAAGPTATATPQAMPSQGDEYVQSAQKTATVGATPQISNTSADLINPHMANLINGNLVFKTVAGIGRNLGSLATDLTTQDYGWNAHDAVKNVPDDFTKDQRDKLAYMDSPGQFNALVSQYAIQNSAKQFQQSNTTQAIAESFVTGLFDPVARAASLGSWARMGLGGIAGAATSGAISNTAVTVGEEGIAHATGDGRSYQESLVNVAMSPIIGAIVGGGHEYLNGLKVFNNLAGDASADNLFKTPVLEEQPTNVIDQEGNQLDKNGNVVSRPEPKTPPSGGGAEAEPPLEAEAPQTESSGGGEQPPKPPGTALTFKAPEPNEPLSSIAVTLGGEGEPSWGQGTWVTKPALQPGSPLAIKTIRTLTGEQLPLFGNTFLHLQNNESATARAFAADHSVTGVKMQNGEVADARTLQNQRDNEVIPRLAQMNKMRAALYKEYKNDVTKNPVQGLDTKNLSAGFDVQVHHYIASGGAPGFEGEAIGGAGRGRYLPTNGDEVDYHPAVKKLGDHYLKTINPVWERYIDAMSENGKLTPEDAQFIQQNGPNYAANYFARNYNLGKIKSDGGKAFVDWLSPRVGAENARDIYNNVVGETTKISDERSGDYIPKNFFRKLNIPDTQLIEGGWMNSDIRGMFKNFLYRHVPDTLYLERYGDVHPQSIIDGIKKDYETQMTGATGQKTKALDAQLKSTLKSVQFMQDDFRYRTGMFANMNRDNWKRTDPSFVAARAVQYMQTYYNAANLNSAFFRDAAQFGQSAMFNDIDRVLGTTIQKLALSIGKHFNDGLKTLDKGERNDLFSSSVGLAHSVDYTNYEPVADMNLSVMSKVEKMVQETAAYSRRSDFLDASDIMHDMMETLGSSVFNNRALTAITKAGGEVANIKAKDLDFLRGFGIKDEYIPRIFKEFQANGDTINGILPRYDYHIPFFGKWADKEAAEVYQNAMMNMSRGSAINNTFQSNPFLRNDLLGNIIGSLSGFMNSVIGRTLIPAISQDKGLFMTGMAAMIGAHIVGHMINDNLKGEAVEGWDNIRDKYVKPGIERVIGFRFADLAQKGYNTAKPFMNADMKHRPAEAADFLEAAARTTTVGSMADDVGHAGVGAYNTVTRLGNDQTPRAKDIDDMGRIMPFRNIVGISGLYKEAGNQIKDYYGIDDSKPIIGNDEKLQNRMENDRMRAE